MATHTASVASYATLSANTVDTFTLTGSGNTLRVVTTSGSTHSYFTAALPSQTPATPTVGGDDTYTSAHAAPSYVDYPWHGCGAVIKVISSGTPTIGFMLI